MATYRGRKTDICRKLGTCICGKTKCPSHKRPYPTGEHGLKLKEKRSTSQHGEQLFAKQVIRRYYNMLEKQFSNSFDKALHMPGNTGLNFLRLLELRLQTLVRRLGYAKSVYQARQMVSHCHILVNGKVVNIPSYQVKIGDIIEVRDRPSSRNIAIKNHYEAAPLPAYMESDISHFKGSIISLPEREDFPKFFQEQQVVEYYGKR